MIQLDICIRTKISDSQCY